MTWGRWAGIPAAQAEPLCRRCGYFTRLVLNTYYGTGLAVHRHIRICRRCNWDATVREASRSSAVHLDSHIVELDDAGRLRRDH
jgi:hypothetical protein